MAAIDYIIIGVYLLAMIVIGFVAKGHIKTMDDFILGGRRFNKFALIGTIMATMVGSGMTIGAVGTVYKSGITGSTFWMYTGFSIGFVIQGFISKKIRDTGARSLSEIFYLSFGKEARLVSAVVVTGYAVALVAINIAGLRTIIMYIFGDQVAISLPMATAIAALISILYTALGGFFAVVWTDVAQLIIMIVGVFIIGPIIGVSMAGGVDVIVQTYVNNGTSFTNPLALGFSPALMGIALASLLAVPGDPSMPQRVLSAKNDKVAKISFFVSGGLGIYFGAALLFIGGSVAVLMPNLENAEAALPLFVLNYYPQVLKGITLAGIIAAIMSSFDSFLILATTHVMYDIGSVIKPDLSENTIKKSLPIMTVIIGVLGIIIALFITSLMTYLSMVFSIIGSAVVPVLIAALYFKTKVSKAGVVGSIIAGTVVPAYLFITKGYDVFLGDPVFIGVFASVTVLVLGSIFIKDKQGSEKKVEKTN